VTQKQQRQEDARNHPIRTRLLAELECLEEGDDRTARQLKHQGDLKNQSVSSIDYHLGVLERVDLVEVAGTTEGGGARYRVVKAG
jgi:hypothetical protein